MKDKDLVRTPVLKRALRMLEIVAEAQDAVTFNTLLEGSGASKAAGSRIITTLKQLGYLDEGIKANTYETGIACYRLGTVPRRYRSLRSAARESMNRLSEETGECVVLAVYVSGEVVYIDKRDSKHPVAPKSYIGFKAPAYCVSTGMALLSCQTDEEIKRRISGELLAYTDLTETAPEKIKEELEKVVKRGYAYNPGAYREGVGGIAAPICDGGGVVWGAIGYCMPTYRMEQGKLMDWAKAVKREAGRIAQELGYREEKW